MGIGPRQARPRQAGARKYLTAAPASTRAWFSDELDVGRSAISVWDGRGRRVDNGKGGADLNDLDRKSLVATLKPATVIS